MVSAELVSPTKPDAMLKSFMLPTLLGVTEVEMTGLTFIDHQYPLRAFENPIALNMASFALPVLPVAFTVLGMFV